jgi:Mg2+/Co2+ transporter CorB
MFISLSWQIFYVAILIILAGLVSCFETAITTVSKAKIWKLKNEGCKKAKKLEKLLQDRAKLVSVMLLTNNAINIIASSLTTKILLELFGEIGVVYSTVFLTIVIIVFGEILPKTLALQQPEKIAVFFSYLINLLYQLCLPIVNVIEKIINKVVCNFHKTESNKNSELEEIRNTIELKAKEGSIFKYDKDLLDGVLDLSDTSIIEIMVHRKNIASINYNLSIAEIIKKAINIGYTRIPLWQNQEENITHILNVRKMLKALYLQKADINNFDLQQVVSTPFFVPNSNTLKAQLFAFRKIKKRMAIIIDEYGSVQGLITLEDILEEIVGEIKEPDEINEINIVKSKSGLYKVSGKTLIHDLNKKLNWQLPTNEEALNVSAYIINYLGRIPEEKEMFTINNFYFEIVKKNHNDIILIKIKKIN